MTRTSSPILWYGDLVDFGSFSTSASDGGDGKPITFSFGLDEVKGESTRMYFVHSPNEYPYSFTRRQQTYRDVVFKIAINKSGERNRLSSLVLMIKNLGCSIEIEFDNEGRATKGTINEIDFLSSLEQARLYISPGEFLPTIRYMWPKSEDRSGLFPDDSGRLAMPMRRILREKIHGRVADKTVAKLTYQLLSHGVIEPETLKRVGKEYGARVHTTLSEIADRQDSWIYQELLRISIIVQLQVIFRSVNSSLRSILGSTLYTGPARAKSERYYRYQDLSVSEIDPDGKNFPMFLNSLTARQKTSLSDWVHSLFGYGIKVSSESGHISIELTDGERQANIVDVGYGVSQILPVLGQIWWARERSRSPANEARPLALLAVEQPELHLHPAHQALLADALVGDLSRASTPSAANARMHYLVETHSETMINRLGELVASGRLPQDEVQIVLFERDPDNPRLSKVFTAQFGQDGSLLNWPYGFFQPDVS